ncbi:MAG: hypothetical protein WBE56_12790 [Terracidiphilus sp.]
MKTSLLLVLTLIAGSGIAGLAQQTDADDAAKTTYAPAAAGFGDQAASRSWEMTSVSAELDGKLDSKSAKVGDRVTLKTTDKVQISDGTVIPRGSHLVGHITQVQAHSGDRVIAQVAIAFDHFELKNGQSVAVHSLIRTVRPSAAVMSMNGIDNDNTMDASNMGGGRMGAGRSGGGVLGGGVGASGGVPTAAGGMGGDISGGVANRTPLGTSADANTNLGASTGAGAGVNQEAAVQLDGHGDAPIEGGAHAAAAARAVPHQTAIPGIMLAGSSSASGLLIDADRRDLEFVSGTRFEMGIVADQ